MIDNIFKVAGKKAAEVYFLGKEEKDRNPNFDLMPSMIACVGYIGLSTSIHHYAYFSGKEKSITISRVAYIAIEIISSLFSGAVSAALCHFLSYRVEMWAYDLAFDMLFHTASRIIPFNLLIPKQALNLSKIYARNLIEGWRNPLIDPISLTISSAIISVIDYMIPLENAKSSTTPASTEQNSNAWQNNQEDRWSHDNIQELPQQIALKSLTQKLNRIAIKALLPQLVAWLFTPSVCSLLGRKVVVFSYSNVLALALCSFAQNSSLVLKRAQEEAKQNLIT
ncbi:MAG: hypothetical protein AAF443_01980 [Chlamydiota bacterium]